MLKFNSKEVDESLVEVEEVTLTEIEEAKAVLAQARKEKLNKVLDKSKAVGKKALMYAGPALAIGGLGYLYKKANSVDPTVVVPLDGDFEVVDTNDNVDEFVINIEETGE